MTGALLPGGTAAHTWQRSKPGSAARYGGSAWRWEGRWRPALPVLFNPVGAIEAFSSPGVAAWAAAGRRAPGVMSPPGLGWVS